MNFIVSLPHHPDTSPPHLQICSKHSDRMHCQSTRVYPKLSGLTGWYYSWISNTKVCGSKTH